MRRTLSGVENELGQCAGATRDRLDGLLAAEEVLPSISSSLGIEDELMSAYELNSQDSLELAKAKQAFKKEELEAARREIADLDKKILDAVSELKSLFQQIEEIRMKLAESKKASRKRKIDPLDHLEALNNVSMAKSAVKRLDQLRLEFEMWMKRLKSINKRSKVLQNPEVIRLVVHFQKMDKMMKKNI